MGLTEKGGGTLSATTVLQESKYFYAEGIEQKWGRGEKEAYFKGGLKVRGKHDPAWQRGKKKAMKRSKGG